MVVYNVHHQTEPSDIFGGFRPLNIKTKFLNLINLFKNFITSSASKDVETTTLDTLNKAFAKDNYTKSMRIMIEKTNQLDKIIADNRQDLFQEWRNLTNKIFTFEREIISNVFLPNII